MKYKKPISKYNCVMLIDDNEIDNFINQKMIEGSNFAERIFVHTSGKSAIEFLSNLSRIKEIPTELIPEIIFVDINMPIMDGFQFLEEFENMPENIKQSTRVVMLTTSINPSDLDRSQANSRMLKYVNKPLSTERLNSI